MPTDREKRIAERPWKNWGEGRDEYPIRDMRYSCPRCHIVRSFIYRELCEPCRRKVTGDANEKERP